MQPSIYILTLILLTAATATTSLRYLGCYLDNNSLHNLGQSPFQSVGACRMHCTRRGNPIMGLRNGTECWCGNGYPGFEDELDPGACNLRCGGFPRDTCGGFSALSCYEIEEQFQSTTHALAVSPTSGPDLSARSNVRVCGK